MRSRSRSARRPALSRWSTTWWVPSPARRGSHEPMSVRALIVALIAVSTIGFAVGTTIERNTNETHAERAAAPPTSARCCWSGERPRGIRQRRRAPTQRPGAERKHDLARARTGGLDGDGGQVGGCVVERRAVAHEDRDPVAGGDGVTDRG